MKTISTIMLGIILMAKLSGQCHKIPDPVVPNGYVIISTMNINMKVSENKAGYSPYFLLKNNNEYKLQIINADGFSTNAEVRLFEDNILIGTNYDKDNNEIHSDFSFKCKETKAYNVKVEKINKNQEYCGKLILFAKLEGANNNIDNTNSLTHDPEIFILVEKMPRFIDKSKRGDIEFSEWINNQEKVKQIVKQTNLTGKVYVNFVLDTEGNVNDVKVIRGVNATLDSAAVDIVKASPKWKSPGYQIGEPKNIQFTIYVNFKSE